MAKNLIKILQEGLLTEVTNIELNCIDYDDE